MVKEFLILRQVVVVFHPRYRQRIYSQNRQILSEIVVAFYPRNSWYYCRAVYGRIAVEEIELGTGTPTPFAAASGGGTDDRLFCVSCKNV
jgi:hypothetical protein